MSENSDALDFSIGGSTPAPIPGAPVGPIRDVSYRNYDGILKTRAVRWWVIAFSGVKTAKQKKGFWIVLAISVLPYLFTMLQLYLTSRAPAGSALNFFGDADKGHKFAFQFWNTFQFQMFFLFILAVMIGAGSIALDNRSNAMLVYLSKPITRGDYLIGKWMGSFLVLFAAAAAPALLLWGFCLLTFYSDGFVKDEPRLLMQILAAQAVPAAIHTSLMVGISAWSKTPRMAGAIYAGLYFSINIVVGVVWAIRTHGSIGQDVLIQHLSIEGVITGIAQNIFNVAPRMPIMGRSSGPQQIILHPPNFTVMLLLGAAMVLFGITLARLRIRAVEVVRG